ncbi:MAG TPA: SDR family NAD(P)-dependent oxidoreductase [Gaiellales bacterium]|jgi:short-subunit dehydrogenase|nr:SDR family NAD(P)-dependent oxidoreductase [Gaiellales bacterium]
MARLAMITGASSGIGEAFADRLAGDGWDLVLVARRRDRLEQVAERVKRAHRVSAVVLDVDLADPVQLEALGAETAELPLGLLVNNAALAHYKPFATLPAGQAQELVDLNVLAPVLLTRAVVEGMMTRGEGAVINVASLLAFSGAWDKPHLPQRAIYAASKSFLVTFSQILARELEGSGVRVQVVCPGVVRTEFHSRQGLDMSEVPRMEPASVVEASLRDLEEGLVVSIPGADDDLALRRIEAAAATLMPATRTVELPERYRD